VSQNEILARFEIAVKSMQEVVEANNSQHQKEVDELKKMISFQNDKIKTLEQKVNLLLKSKLRFH
jgi:hypothetical protein